MDVDVRAATEGDLPLMLPLLDALYAGRPPRSPRPTLTAIWREMLGLPGRTVLIAECDGVAVGTLDLVVVARLARDARPWALVEDVVVAPGWRRRGVASVLLADAVRRAHEADCYRIQLSADLDDPALTEMYRQAGFEALGTTWRRYLVGDE